MDNNQENNKPLSRVLSKLFKRKNPDDMMKVARRNGLKKTLTAIDLIVLGIGILIGSGIFAVPELQWIISTCTSPLVISIECIFATIPLVSYINWSDFNSDISEASNE